MSTDGKPTEDIVPPTPLHGEDDEGEVPGFGTGSSDDTIPTPVPEFPSEDKSILKGATDVRGVQGFSSPSDEESTSGVGNVNDRGTVAGYGVVDEGDTGTGALGMEGTESTDVRSTEPLSEQGEVTGAEDTD